jgi:hypothetical protein
MGDGQCTATSKQTHQRCKQPVVLGAQVCYYHGGAAPEVKHAAQERLRALQHPAIDRLGKLIDQDEFPTVAYAASKDVLDRTLGKAAETQELTINVNVTITERLQRARARFSD